NLRLFVDLRGLGLELLLLAGFAQQGAQLLDGLGLARFELAGVRRPANEVDVQVVGQSADEQSAAKNGQDSSRHEQVIADRHEIDVRPAEKAEHAQLLQPTHRCPQVE